MESSYLPPSLDGNPLLHDLLDHQAALHPDRPYFCYTQDDVPDELIFISQLEVSRASHRAARYLSELPEYDRTRREVVAVLALADTPMYTALMLGACRAGMVPLFVAPYITLDAMVGLLRECVCTRILATPTLSALAEKIVAQLSSAHPDLHRLRIDLFPTLQQIYPHLEIGGKADDNFQPFHGSLKDVGPDDVYFYMHSSGSTGSPKLIPFSRRVVTSRCRAVFYKTWSTFSPPLRLAVLSVYMFHISGVASVLLGPVMSGACMVVYLPTVKTFPQSLPYSSTPRSVLAHSRRAGCDALLAMPSLLQVWAHTDSDVEYLKTFRFVLYGGGPLVTQIGDTLSERGVKLVCIYGSTEVGIVSDLEVICDKIPSGWTYQRIAPNIPVRWVDQKDGTYEPHFLVSPTYAPSMLNLPNEDGYATADVLEPHPLDSTLWKCVGRLNNVIVLSTGDKFAPEPLEDTIGAHPSVQAALIFGRGRAAPGVLIEPRLGGLTLGGDDSEEEGGRKRFINELWPTIEEACTSLPSFAHISRGLVLLTTKDKPLPRAAKGSVLVQAALDAYEREIDVLYQSREPARAFGSE